METHFRTDKREKIVFLYGVIAPSSANSAANIHLLFGKVQKKEVQAENLHLFSCCWQDCSAVFGSAGRLFRNRSSRKGSFLRFAIVKVHWTFTSLPRSRRLRRCRCRICWNLHWDCRLGSRRRPCCWGRSLLRLEDRPAVVPGTSPGLRPAMLG